MILQALGDEQEADQLAAVRYKDVLQEDGTVLWGAMVVENATCKRGQTRQRIHTAQVYDPGQTWADQLESKVEASVGVGWELDLAEKCKGEGTVDLTVTSEPFADVKAWKAWVESEIFELKKEPVEKRMHIEETPLRI